MKSALILLAYLSYVSADPNSIIIPKQGDKYSEFVQKLENGDTLINYIEFRESYLNSKKYTLRNSEYDNLKKNLFKEVSNNNTNNVITIAKEMLNIDYTSMYGHKYLQQALKISGDSINSKKYHDIEFGLLNSIVKVGDGKSCSTGWHVTKIEEEYFILQMINVKIISQSLISEGGKNCDAMNVTDKNGNSKIYYFEVDKVLEAEMKSLQN